MLRTMYLHSTAPNLIAALLQVYEFTGQGSKKPKSTKCAGGYEAVARMRDDRHVQGMSGDVQQARLNAFKVRESCNDLPLEQPDLRRHSWRTFFLRVDIW